MRKRIMTISVMDEDGWGESVERYQWSDSGQELLVQLTESLRVYVVKGGVTERSVIPVGFGDILEIGSAAGGWWLLTKQGDVVAYRQGLEGRDLPLEGAVASEMSLPTVSPNGRIIACVVGNLGVGFWSTSDGARLFGIKLLRDGDEESPLGELSIDSMNWSPDSRHLAIQPGFPMAELLVVDVEKQKCLAQL